MKFLNTLFLLMIFGNSYAFDFYVMKKEDDHLYLSDYKQIDDMDTVTYLIDIERPDTSTAEVFSEFSESIGKLNGAALLIPSDIKAFKHISKSKCDLSYTNSLTVVFEDKINSKCFRFNVNDSYDFIKAIGDIYAYINNNRNLDKEILKNRSKSIINETSKEFEIELSMSIQEFVNYIIESVVSD